MILLGADTAQFQQDLGQASQTASSSFDDIKASAKDMAIAVAGAFTIDAIAGFIDETVQAAVDVDNLAKAIGVNSQDIQKYQFMLMQSGIEADKFGDAMSGLNEKILEAATEGGDAERFFKSLGVNVKDASGNIKNANDVTLEIADAFSKMSDGAVKSSIASELMGDAGAELIPILNKGSKGLEELGDQAVKAGYVMDEKAIKSAREYKQAMNLLEGQIHSAGTQVVSGMLPALSQVTAAMANSTTGTNLLEKSVSGVGTVFKVMVGGVIGSITVLEVLGDTIGRVAAAGVAVINGDIDQARTIMDDSDSVMSIIDSRLNQLTVLWQDTGNAAVISSQQQQDAAQKTANSLAVAKSLIEPKEDKKPKEAKDNFEYGGLNLARKSLADYDLEVAESAQKYIAAENEKAAQAYQTLQQSLLSKRELEEIDYQEKLQKIQTANELEIGSEGERYDALLRLKEQHSQNIKAIDQEETAAAIASRQTAMNFITGSFSQLAQKSETASKAVQAINKITALRQIYQDTPAAAMAAAKAVAGIPIVGPALATAATVAMYGLGAAAAASVLSGGGSLSAPSSSTPNISVPNASESVQPTPQQQTVPTVNYVRVRENDIFLGREILDLLNRTMADGGTLDNLRFIPA